MSRAHIGARLERHALRVTIFRRRVLSWFRRDGRVFPWRLRETTLYGLIISELLLQRTRAETVAAFFPQFISHFPDWIDLSRASNAEMRTFLKPIGLWRRRASTLQKLGRAMEARKGALPKSRDQLEQLPGFGQYVVNAAMMFSQGACEPLLDVNMARVLERVFGPRRLVDIRYDPWLQGLARKIVRSRQPREVNWAVLDLAAMICTRQKPKCASCPACEICLYAIRRRIARADVVVPITRSGKPLRVPPSGRHGKSGFL